MTIRATLILVCLALFLSGCGGARNAYVDDGKVYRNIAAGEAYYQDAKEHLHEDVEKAEKLLRKALAEDLYHGPAHNNLGVILMQRGELYQAANEFAWARKLMPGHPDPRVNLAIALDRGGQYGEAIQTCQTALEVRPEYLPAIQALTLIQIRENQSDDTLIKNLELIRARSSDEKWRNWATLQLHKRQS